LAVLIGSAFPKLAGDTPAVSLEDFGSLTDSVCFAFTFRIATEVAATGFFAGTA